VGHFYYSAIRSKPTVERVEADLQRISMELFETKFRIERSDGIPNSRADDRRARWEFWLTDPARAFGDCSFTISMLRDGRFEFKVPRSQWDEHWEDQQKIRRRLVRLYNPRPTDHP